MFQPSSKTGNRQAEALTTYTHPSPDHWGFLSLPREIRNMIYAHALTRPSPIIVWSGTVRRTTIEHPPDPNAEPDELFGDLGTIEVIVDSVNRDMDYSSIASSRIDLNLGLLRCHPHIAREATIIFYQSNTFSFLGYHSWHPIVSWLKGIGPQNIGNLTNLEIFVPPPMHVRQENDGSRIGLYVGHWRTYEEVAQCHPRLSLPTEEPLEGIVENIHPAVEEFFRLLGPNRSKLNLSLLLYFGLSPGSQMSIEEDQHPEGSYFGMDLPNLIELFRVLYTSDASGTPRVEVT